MADLTYKNVTITGAATLEEAKEQAALAYLQQFNEAPTQAEIDALLAEIEAEEAEGVDFDALEAEITGELAWILTARADVAAGIGILDGGATLAQTRGVVKGLAQIVDRMLIEQQRELRAWRYVIRRLP